jgi:hypothetical protein
VHRHAEQEVRINVAADMKPFRVLSLDGGGMRGTYTATYLSCLATDFANKRGLQGRDVGGAFDLIVGTSTGAIIACSLAAEVPLSRVLDLYRNHGRVIFPHKLPGRFGFALIRDYFQRSNDLRSGNEALSKALEQALGDITVAQVYERRKIALAIAAVDLAHHHAWVFKTPHNQPKTNHRDDNYRLVDVCLASSAAPIFRSLAAVKSRGAVTSFDVFADGGLWANNPVLIGLIEALEMTRDSPGQEIELFCLGTCPRPAGEIPNAQNVHRGLKEWAFGGEVAKLAINAQEFAYDHMARLLSPHLNRKCHVVRFPRQDVPAPLLQYLDLDETREEALDALVQQARSDVNMTNSSCNDPNDRDGALVKKLFTDMPALRMPDGGNDVQLRG